LYTSTLTVPALGHAAFSLKDQFPQTSNTYGTVQLTAAAGLPDGIAVVGLRFNPTGPFTTVPAVVAGEATASAPFRGKSVVRIEGSFQQADMSIPLVVELRALPGSEAFFASGTSKDSREIFVINWEATAFLDSRFIAGIVASAGSRYTGPDGLLNEPVASAGHQSGIPRPTGRRLCHWHDGVQHALEQNRKRAADRQDRNYPMTTARPQCGS